MNEEMAKRWREAATESIQAANAWSERGLRAAQWPAADLPAMALGALDQIWAREAPFAQNEQPDSARWSPNEPTADELETGLFSCAFGTREYRLLAPKSAQQALAEGRDPPLLVFLHGCRQSAASFETGVKARELAEKKGFFALFPQQSKKANGWGCWNWFRAANQKRDGGEAALIASMARGAQLRLGVSERRVFALGLSAGGSMALALSSLFPEVFSACASHSGLPFASARDLPGALMAMRGGAARQGPSPQTPLIVFQGMEDETVSSVNAQRSLARAVGREEPHSKTLRKMGGRSVEILSYEDGHGQPRQELWLIEGAGHAWSGGDPAGGYADAAGPNATLEALRFFNQASPAVRLEKA
jgi:poly(hydroxyalkanoate) depolymerase family esterase